MLATASSEARKVCAAANRRVGLLHGAELSADERNLLKFADFVGVSIAAHRLGESRAPNGAGIADTLFVRAEVLARYFKQTHSVVLPDCLSGATDVFVYGFEPGTDHDHLVGELSGGALTGVEPAPHGGRFEIAGERSFCGSLNGLSLGSSDPATDLVFRRAEGRQIVSLMQVGDQPFLALATVRGCRAYLSGCRSVPDLDQLVALDEPPLRCFSSIAPFIMMLRSVAGAAAWHNPAPQACFIIDDPPLRRRYGFLDYRKFVEVLRREQASASIAFIPWNYRRSDPRTVEIFRNNPAHLSLCIHGCDHTAREFGAANPRELRNQSRWALERMAAHERQSGLACDDVMVFPQGVFALGAMEALRDSGYLAAVNTTLLPVDVADTRVALKELLDVALTRFSGFPLFARRYPANFEEIAFDLFLGKPALLVEHHNFFREGYDRFAEAIQRVQKMDPRLQWSNLGAICSTTCLVRELGNEHTQVRFFTHRFQFRATAENARNYTLTSSTRFGDSSPVVTVNGQDADYEVGAEGWTLADRMIRGDRVEFKLIAGDTANTAGATDGRFMRRAGVFLRRHLCEFRDNYIQPNWPARNRAEPLVK